VYTHEVGEEFATHDLNASRTAQSPAQPREANLNEQLHVGCQIFAGDSSAANAAEYVAELAETFTLAEAAYDPWQGALLAETMEQRGLTAVQFPQSDSPMQPASERLHRAVIERRLVHDGDPHLAAHVHAATAKSTPRGWRLHRAGPSQSTVRSHGWRRGRVRYARRRARSGPLVRKPPGCRRF